MTTRTELQRERDRRDVESWLPLLIDRTRARRDAAYLEAGRVIEDEIRRGRGVAADLAGEANKTYRDAMGNAKVHEDRLERLEAVQSEKFGRLRVREPRTYDRESPHSYFHDLMRFTVVADKAAGDRLNRYSLELQFEEMRGSPEGERVRRVAEARARQTGDASRITDQRRTRGGGTVTELRAGSTVNLGAFVTPQYLVEDRAAWRTYGPAFHLQTVQVPDAGYGVKMYVPAFTSGADVGEQLEENSGVPDEALMSEYLEADLGTFVGKVDVSQQFFDRAGPVAADTIIYAQLMMQLWSELDAATILTALANAGTVTSGGSFSVASLYGDLAKARSQMATADGTKLPATHIFMPPEFYEWALAQCDPNGRPILLPTPAGCVLPILPDPKTGEPPVGYTGERLLSSAVFSDGNIPETDDSGAQLVVANMADVVTLTTEPVLRAMPETFASDLAVMLQAYVLGGAIVRHAAAIQVVSGDAYPANPEFA